MSDKRKGSILIVDDDRDVLKAAAMLVKQHLEIVVTSSDPESLPALLTNERFDVVLLDMNFARDVTSGEEGLYHLKKIKSVSPATVVILITAYGDVDLAVRSIKEGATDFVLKPWSNEKLLATIFSALDLSQSRSRIELLTHQNRQLSQDGESRFHDLIGNSPPMQSVFATMNKVAKTDVNVLISGENGTGKELVARGIHRDSLRAGDVFIGVDMGAISETLFESELFGHERGAFTDAIQARPGRFELASGGTLFLDEIGNLPLHLQAKILRVLETREVQRLGAIRSTPIDIRLICATNMNLTEMVKEGRFREDLLYRINTVEISLPPLRERIEDLTALAEHFIGLFARKYKKTAKALSRQALDKLKSHRWPGNIREFKHAIERALILSETEVLSGGDFVLKSSDTGGGEGVLRLEEFNLDDVEKTVILRVVKKYGGNISRAAEELGLTRASLYRRMEKHGL
jgi:DNA-binding NtrC family response regulator